MENSIYASGEYLARNPSWHAEDAPWKVGNIRKMLTRHGIEPQTVCECGCGAGQILAHLRDTLGETAEFIGYEVSPQAYERCKAIEGDRLRFELGDMLEAKDLRVDLLLLMDVVEHIADCVGFLRGAKDKARWKLLHFPLDLSVQAVLRGGPLIHVRRSVGHIHYFSKELALEVLDEADYRVVDHFFTATTIDLPPKSFKSRLARVPRRALGALSQDLSARLLGGYSLMVLAQ